MKTEAVNQLGFFRHLFLLMALFLIPSTDLEATHIVGGEMNYVCLGNDDYEITLTVFRDCENGIPNFDNPAHIGIFGSDNELVDEIGFLGVVDIDYILDDTLDPTLFDSCLVIPPDVCVDVTTYVDTVSLPFRVGGYNVVYQRCCRNHTINNIVAPDSTGATYSIYITEQALLECNSNAVFKEWPPTYICRDEPILFDHSALDPDGDSLVYKLCVPLHGGEFSCYPNSNTIPPCHDVDQPCGPRPCPPFNPPFNPVVWDAPEYGLWNVLGGVPLSIDSETGFLTGIPDSTGQYVVGICVEEYRNGVLISETRRDFQYNVGVCGEVISSFFAPAVDCDGFSVDFDNQSENAPNYSWDFGDPSTTQDVSNQQSPTYVYPDTGLYQIQLIAGPNELCADTSYSTVYVQQPSLFVDFDLSIIDGCVFPAQVSFDDLTYDTISTLVEWDWQFSNGDSSDLQDPVWYVTEPGTYVAELTVTAANGCQVSHTDVISIDVLDLALEDTMLICADDFAILNPGTDPSLTYTWSPGNTLNSINAPSPIATPLTTTTYYVTVEDNEGCFYTDSILVNVFDLVVNFTSPITICPGDTIPIHDGIEPNLDYSWFPNTELIASETGSPLAYDPEGGTYYVTVTDQITGCRYIDSVTVIPKVIENISPDAEICEGESVSLNNDGVPNMSYGYEWFPDTDLDDPSSPNPVASPATTTTYYVNINNAVENCEITDSILVIVNPAPISAINDVTNCLDEVTELNPFGSTQYDYNWFPTTGLSDPTSPNPIINLTEPATYYITITNPVTSCETYDTIQIDVQDLMVSFATPLTVCPGDTIPLHNGTEPNLDYVWFPDDQMINPNTGTPLSYAPQGGTFYVTVTDEVTGCTYLDSVIVIPKIIDEILTAAQICEGESVELNDLPNLSYEYEWFPSTGLSDPTNPNPIATPESTTLYYVNINDDATNCEVLDSIEVVVNPLPTSAIADVEGCQDEPTDLNPLANLEYQYNWSPSLGLSNPTDANPTVTVSASTTYYATIVDPLTNCETYDTVNIFIPEPITVEASDDEIGCEPELDISATSNTAQSYEWFEDPALSIAVGSGSDLTVMPGESSTYFVLATDSYGCTAVSSVTVGSRPVDVEVPSAIEICAFDSLSLGAVNMNPDDILEYNWAPSEILVDGAGTANPTFYVSDDEIITLIVDNQYGCADTVMIPVDVIENSLDVIALAEPDSIYYGESSQLEANTNAPTNYQWTMGELLDDDGIQNPLATPLETTTFHVFVEDSLGCKDTASVTVYLKNFICEEPYIFVPNAFTPDGDGNNDRFKVRGNSIDELYLAVYNRWGEMVFETRDLNIGWDGTFKGKAMPPDVFGYYLQLKCLNGDEYFKKGNVTLIR